MSLHLGTAKVDITPSHPVPLAGFGFRRGNSEGVQAPLFLKVFSFRYDDGKRVILLIADLLGWDTDTVAECRKRIVRNECFADADLVFHATHTHCGPQISRLFSSGLGRPDDGYIDFLLRRVEEACPAAIKNEEPVEAFLRDGTTSIPINRRRRTDAGVEMAPNPEGEIDRTVTLVDFARADGTLKGQLIHTACHLTSSGDNRVSSEFAGIAAERWSESFPERPLVGFMQGFCGDVRPALVRNDQFYRGSLDRETEDLADIFLEELSAIRSTAPSPIELESRCLRKKVLVALPLENNFTSRVVAEHRGDEGYIGEWARFWEAKGTTPDTLTVELSAWRPGKKFAFLFAGAEVVGHYAIALKASLSEKVLCCGYTDGVATYIPTACQLAEGGYESRDAMYWFLTPAPFAPECEEIFMEALRELL